MDVRRLKVKWAGGLAVSVASLLAATVALSQEEASPDLEAREETGIEEIIVTGSRLRRRDFNAPSPITSIDNAQIRNSGQPNLEAALNQMPQVTPV